MIYKEGRTSDEENSANAFYLDDYRGVFIGNMDGIYGTGLLRVS
jgi:hypothetical protein